MLIEYETFLRLSFFLGIFMLICAWELASPKRHLSLSRATRWPRNLAMVAIITLIMRLLIPFTAVMAALYAQQHQIGFFHLFSSPKSLAIISSIILLDGVIYAQHRAFHYLPLLWRLHKIHHIDQEIDVTTALRFHPFEFIISLCIKNAAVLLIGAPVAAVIGFEILLNGMAMFNHGNITLPKKFDRILRVFVVTPDMHRVHHSVQKRETNSNFGFSLSLWDKLFYTYLAHPEAGHLQMEIGLKEYPNSDNTGLWALMLMPFRNKKEL